MATDAVWCICRCLLTILSPHWCLYVFSAPPSVRSKGKCPAGGGVKMCSTVRVYSIEAAYQLQ